MDGCVILVTLIETTDLVEVGKSKAEQGWHQDLAAEAVLVSVWCATVSLLCCPGTKVQMAEGQQQDDGAPAAFKLPWWQLAVNYSILLLLPQLLLADDALDQQGIVACIGHLLLGPPTPGEEEEGGMEKHNWLAVI